MHDYYDGGWGVGQWLGMSLMMLLLLGALAAVIVWAVRASGSSAAPPTSGSGRAPTPLEVLADRFARGEIDAEEFTRARELLTTPPRPTSASRRT